MNTQRLRQVRELFSQYDAPRNTVRHYQRQWVRSVRHLGDKWLLSQHIERKEVIQ